jgi:DNA-binding Xre family transcriptional regulator
MHVEIRVREVMLDYNLYHHGVIQEMAEATGLSRHTIRRLISGESVAVTTDTLGWICGYLYAQGVTEGLPGILFGARPARLVDALALHRDVTVYLAEYRRQGDFPRSWVARDDSAVLARFFAMIARSEAEKQPLEVKTEYVASHLPPPGTDLIPSALEEDRSRAKALFRRMVAETRGGFVIVGSQRANLLSECFVSDIFGCKAFEPGRSKVPLYLKYQEHARGPSCFGGDDPPTGEGPSAPPGIYYQRKVGAPWELLPSTRGKHGTGAGGVILRRDAAADKLEVLVFGLTAISTAAMGKIIASQPDSFWFTDPQRSGVQVAVFLCGFDLLGMVTNEESIDELEIGDPEIIPLEIEPARRRRVSRSSKADANHDVRNN